jgi:hypothetical protein
VFETVIPVLGELVNTVINTFDQSEGSRQIVYLICKILYASNQYQMTHYMMQPGCLDPWVQFLKTIMERPMPFECETFNEEDMLKVQEMEKRVEWKIKGLAAKFSYRLLNK